MSAGGKSGAPDIRSIEKRERIKRATKQSLMGRDTGRADARLKDFSKPQ